MTTAASVLAATVTGHGTAFCRGLMWPFHAQMAAVKLKVSGSLCCALPEQNIWAATSILWIEVCLGLAEKPIQALHSLSHWVDSIPSGDPVLPGQSEQGTHYLPTASTQAPLDSSFLTSP